jgi:hypothetical protein
VLTDAENNGTQGTRGFIQVQGLREDKNPMSCVHRLYYDSLG